MRSKNFLDAVWDKVIVLGPNDCWNWTGAVKYSDQRRAYGKLNIEGMKGVYAHRAAYLSKFPGSIELKPGRHSGQHLLHTCDNPRCCNPNHLYIGTHAQNMADKVRRGRNPSGVNAGMAKLNEEDVFWIRLQKKYGATNRALGLLYDVSPACISGAHTMRYYKESAL